MILTFKILLITAAGCLAALLMRLILLLPRSSGSLSASFTLPRIDLARMREKVLNMPASGEARKIKLMTGVLLFILIALVTKKIVFGIMAAGAAYYGLSFLAAQKTAKITALLNEQLIEALGMIANSVRAGQSLIQALENMTKESKPPLATEFVTALHQVRMGIPLAEALSQIPQRIPSRDLRIAIASINLARETGGNLGEILSRIAETMRERRKIQGKITALTAQGKASGIVMGCVPFLLLAVLYFIEPALMGLLFSTLAGNIMLLLAVIMIALGMFFINKIVSIDI